MVHIRYTVLCTCSGAASHLPTERGGVGVGGVSKSLLKQMMLSCKTSEIL
jgi:hypothetical protein